MVLSCGHPPGAVESVNPIVGVKSQSVAVAVPVFAGAVLAVHCMVIFGGQVIVGGTLSSTTMIWLHELVLPQSSVAVQVRVMVLSCGQDPATVTSVKVKVGVPSQLSVPVGFPVLAGAVLAVH
jgi:hypothetical protein